MFKFDNSSSKGLALSKPSMSIYRNPFKVEEDPNPAATSLCSNNETKLGPLKGGRSRRTEAGELASFDYLSQEAAIPLKDLTYWPRVVDCPACMEPSITRVQRKICGGTHQMAVLLFICTVVGGPVPYMSKTFKNVEHYCCRCNRRLATYHFQTGTEIHVF